MANFNWNKEQREAIDFRGKNLLLSAAAGSGKTATLTQRIIELLEDPESNAEISRMLIVTFTNDAAAELKTRIAAALTEAIARDPSDKRLVRQLRDLEGAAISTTHSFLLSELKPYFVRFSLPPDFSVCEEAYVAEMKKEIMLDTVSDFFEGQVEVEDFHLLCDALSGARDDESLDGTLLSLWDDLMRL
ncbi:MAG: UvrD-helicase domain-containing protein, partial [Clostridia bacterium]|nr:UvrD-helicase domain-containing protein [Clostridia bacterium]